MNGAAWDLTFAMRTSTEPLASVALVRAALEALDPDVPLFELGRLDRAISQATVGEKVFGGLFSVFGLSALVMACVGLFGMVAFGVLGALTRRWLTPGEATPAAAASDSLRNDLLCGEGDLKSTEPTKLLMRIAETLDGGDAAVREWFVTETAADVWRALKRGAAPEIRAMFDDFLRRYGFRCVNELKLEEPDLHDNPRFAVASVQSYLRTGGHSIAAMDAREASIPRAAEDRVRAALSGPKRWLYLRAVAWARRSVSDRELLRFERTRTFGITRRLFRGIGANLTALGALAREEDVFYLTLDEVMAYQEGRSVTADFRPIVAARRAEFDEYRAGPPLPDRFLTRGAVGGVMRYPSVLLERDLLASTAAEDEPGVLRGTPCSPGVVDGVARVEERLEDAAGIDGEILVTERTDPGWVPIFPACAGLIIERGSLLSHSAVVARELGLPTIVGVRGRPMQRLRSGDRVRMDGASGEIRIL